MLYPSFLALASFVVALLGTRLMILSLRNRPVFLDKPKTGSLHKVPTPRAGGVAVVTTLIMYLIAADADYVLILLLMFLATISMLDDLIKIHPIVRISAHLIAVLTMIHIYHLHIFPGQLSPWASSSILAFGWVAFINMFKMMDGIDGISASESTSICMGILLVLTFADQFTEGLAYNTIIVLGAMCGFWWWNRHPAKIFLGNVGSVPLGFILGFFLLELAERGYGYAAAILPAYYVIDTTVTFLRRILEKKLLLKSHREHFYHQITIKLGRHDKVTHMITGLNILIVMLAILSSIYPEIALVNLLVAYGISGIWALTFARIGRGDELPPH